MGIIDIILILVIVGIVLFYWGIFSLIKWFMNRNRIDNDVFDFERDHEEALSNKLPSENHKPEGESIFIGTAGKKDVFIPTSAKHIFICGTTGSGKTIAISNFIKSGMDYDYPMLIIDGKGDTDAGSLLEITQNLCHGRKIYVINLNDPKKSDKYNPFKNTNPDVIKDMLINMTNWSEEHYKYNTERYIQRLCKLLALKEIDVSLESLTNYLSVDNFMVLCKELSNQKLITKEEHMQDIELAKTSGKIAESAAARFATIKESDLGQIFDSSGIDIYTALKENAVILFILNPLLYPEMSPLIGNLLIIDSKKAVSNFYQQKKKRIFYILDEINVYASTALIDLVNKSRSANVTCILATQSLSDLASAEDDNFKEQIIENCNNYIVLRQNSAINSEAWANILGTKNTMEVTYQMKHEQGATVDTGLGSARLVREFLFHPDEIKSLKTGQAFFLSRDMGQNCRLQVHKPF